MAGMDHQPPTPDPKCRRFRFGLRSFLAIVTVLGCWIGYETNWIRHRHQVLKRPDVEITLRDTLGVIHPRHSVLLWLLREPSYQFVMLQFPLAPWWL